MTMVVNTLSFCRLFDPDNIPLAIQTGRAEAEIINKRIVHTNITDSLLALLELPCIGKSDKKLNNDLLITALLLTMVTTSPKCSMC